MCIELKVFGGFSDCFRCDITDEVDKHLFGSADGFNSYVYVNAGDFGKKSLYIRRPGSTIGCIKLDSTGCITAIEFNECNVKEGRSKCLDESMLQVEAMFLGQRITNPFRGGEVQCLLL